MGMGCAILSSRLGHPTTTQPNQMIAYKIVRNAAGERFLKLANGGVIPAGIARLAAGKDAWMSLVTCKCRDCGESFALRDLNDTGEYCEPCQVADMAEAN
jgi:hypothetical protein